MGCSRGNEAAQTTASSAHTGKIFEGTLVKTTNFYSQGLNYWEMVQLLVSQIGVVKALQVENFMLCSLFMSTKSL